MNVAMHFSYKSMFSKLSLFAVPWHLVYFEVKSHQLVVIVKIEKHVDQWRKKKVT